MPDITFYREGQIHDALLGIAVILAEVKDGWLLCKNKDRPAWEFPAGHREPGETIDETAHRELYEETGALTYTLFPVSIYSVTEAKDGISTTIYGKLFYAKIHNLGTLPDFEIECIRIFKTLPENMTYAEIQHAFVDRFEEILFA